MQLIFAGDGFKMQEVRDGWAISIPHGFPAQWSARRPSIIAARMRNRPLGIKTLSLFCVAFVAYFRRHDDDGNP
ncbi:hypothetical protein [Sphingopyxis witflariensis]|nr:hypothetical protein [Sphingopyxis witflariensis]